MVVVSRQKKDETLSIEVVADESTIAFLKAALGDGVLYVTQGTLKREGPGAMTEIGLEGVVAPRREPST